MRKTGIYDYWQVGQVAASGFGVVFWCFFVVVALLKLFRSYFNEKKRRTETQIILL